MAIKECLNLIFQFTTNMTFRQSMTKSMSCFWRLDDKLTTLAEETLIPTNDTRWEKLSTIDLLSCVFSFQCLMYWYIFWHLYFNNDKWLWLCASNGFSTAEFLDIIESCWSHGKVLIHWGFCSRNKFWSRWNFVPMEKF